MTSRSTIPERVAEMHATLAAQPPSEAIGAFAHEQPELAAGVAPAGRVLPDADLVDVHGAATRLYAATGASASPARHRDDYRSFPVSAAVSGTEAGASCPGQSSTPHARRVDMPRSVWRTTARPLIPIAAAIWASGHSA